MSRVSPREEPTVGVEGVRCLPAAPTGTAALVLGGSSGRIDAPRARLLAEQGVTAESIRWFGGPGQHEGPWEIPLEIFLDRVADLRRDHDRVVVAGVSFGAEAALLTGAHSADVAAVAAFAPSDIVWAGITEDGRTTSHWTLGGEPLPFVPFDESWEPTTDPPSYDDLYRRSRERFADRVAAASIPVERIPEVLVVAGDDDRVWPATTQAHAISARRTLHGLRTALVTDPEAGHRTVLPGEPVVTAGRRMQRGGTDEADRRLGRAAWAALLRLL